MRALLRTSGRLAQRPGPAILQVRRHLSTSPRTLAAAQEAKDVPSSSESPTRTSKTQDPSWDPKPPAISSKKPELIDITRRRRWAGRLVAPTAAPSHSDMFRGPPDESRGMAMEWKGHLSPESLSRHPCILKKAARHLKKPGLISLGGGLPHPSYFPIESLHLRYSNPPFFRPKNAPEAHIPDTKVAEIGKYDVERDGAEYDLSIALNYAQATGSPQMMRWVTEHTELVHDPPYQDWACALTVGSTGSLEQSLRMLCWQGTTMLTEEYSFSTALETARPLGVKVVGVRMDAEGLLPEALDEMVSGWDEATMGRKPHVLYTVPSGQNPTGATMGEQRRRDVYDVCCKHDIVIIEDEPYFFHQLLPYPAANVSEPLADKADPENGKELPEFGKRTGDKADSDVREFLDSLTPSLLSLDTQGRVLRLDSFSKMLMPGSRLGWITAPSQVVKRFVWHAEVANQGPSGMSQVVLWKMLDPDAGGWGHDGFLRWVRELGKEYTRRRDTLVKACEEELPECCSWEPPRAGMFSCFVGVGTYSWVTQMWLTVDHTAHPDYPSRSILDIEEEIFNDCVEAGVLVGCGSWFVADEGAPPRNLCFRTTYASASEENMREAIRRFGGAVRKSFRL